MSEEGAFAKAHQAIGAYFCAFSALERELEEAIKAIFRLQAHEASDAIVAALGDVSKKINLVWSASMVAKNADGSETPNHWKEDANKTMQAIWDCNGSRNQLAHSFLETKADGSVELARLKLEGGALKGQGPSTWTQDNFKTKTERLRNLTRQVQIMTAGLSTFKIPIPHAGWMSVDSFQPMQRQFSSALWEALNPHFPGGPTKEPPLPLRTASDVDDPQGTGG
jgi:hypothetical protein